MRCRAVIWRKHSFGTQSAAGSRFVETLLTVIETCGDDERKLKSLGSTVFKMTSQFRQKAQWLQPLGFRVNQNLADECYSAVQNFTHTGVGTLAWLPVGVSWPVSWSILRTTTVSVS